MKKIISLVLGIAIVLSVCVIGSFSVAADTAITNHTTLAYTKAQIVEKYNAAVASKTYTTSNIYATNPSLSSPYSEGTLVSSLKTDTLNQLNFFRWLAGESAVTLNTSFMQNNQKGALVMAVDKTLSHNPAKPSGMTDAFYDAAIKGTDAGVGYSSNVAAGLSVNNSIFTYVEDTTNISKNVGHRMSMLDRKAVSASFGQVDIYSCTSMHTGTTANNDAFYSWPSAGYFPIDCISSSAKWSTVLNTGYTWDSNPSVTLTYNGKTYKATDVTYESFYNEIYYTVPATLVSATAANGKYKEDTKISVAISGLKKGTTAATISYTTTFFAISEAANDPYVITFTDKNGNPTTASSINCEVGDTFKMDYSFNDTSLVSKFGVAYDPTAFSYDSKTSTFKVLKKGSYAITFEIDGNPELNKTVTFNAGTTAPTTKPTTPTTKPTTPTVPPKTDPKATYGDVNGDGKVNTLDLLTLKKYTVGIVKTINTTNTDVNFDGKYDLKDMLMIKKHTVSIKLFPWD